MKSQHIGLHDPVTQVPDIGPARAKLLARLHIASVLDLLLHLPRAYEDRTAITPIADLDAGQRATVVAESVRAKNVRLRGRMNMAEVVFADSTGEICATWFGRGFLANAFQPGTRAVLTGEVATRKGLALKNPDYEILTEDDADLGRIVPVYGLTDGISQRMLRRWTTTALESIECLDEWLAIDLLEQNAWPTIATAFRDAHWPETLHAADAARRRFAYEELLHLQARIHAMRASAIRRGGKAHAVDGAKLGALRGSLPFALTRGQAEATRNILDDMAAPRPMGRLLQGDVGSGKTVVAFHAIAAAADNGVQSAFMAPTQLLAEQHYATLRRMLEPIGIRCALMTGASENLRALRAEIADANVDVVVGTHALFQDATTFKRLGLVIVDEQHRFGVGQRSRLSRKGAAPDVLHMTATPIPRSLVLTLYGAMDCSVIRELPPGRKPIKTSRIPSEKEADLYGYVEKEAREGGQTYFVCPLIDESETKALNAVTNRYEALSNGPLAALRTTLVHGRMSAEEKEAALASFAAGETDVLFATSVIEVGIDVPKATIMIVDDAAQFGLTQLHQLRGRVGRGRDQSYCFLLGEPRTDEGRDRLEALVATNDGFEIAESDLRLRGPGEVYGFRQAGLTDFRAADVLRDFDLLEGARNEAARCIEEEGAIRTIFDRPVENVSTAEG